MLIFTFLIILLQCQYIQTFTLSRISTHNFIESDTSLNAYAGRSGGGGGGRGGGGSYGGRGGGGGGRGGGGWRGGSRQSDSIPIRFAKTIKIDPSFQTPLAEIGVSDKTRQVLTDKGFELMTPIQSQSYDLVYSGVDVVARSRTGTGKTFAFGLPLIEKVLSLDESLRRRGTLPLILVLEPTRELALQVAQELQSVCSAHRLTVEAMFGGSSFFAQEKALRQGVHILVSTPGRILDHITRGTVDLSGVQHVVLDEGDMMLEMGFQKDVETILSNVKVPGEKSRKAAQQALERDSNDRGRSFSNNDDDDDLNGLFDDADSEGDDFQSFAAKEKRREPVKEGRDVQMLLFSATMPGWICKLTDKHMVEPVFLDAVQEGETRLAASLKHFSLRLPQGGSRVESIQSIAEDLILTRGAGGQTIVFTNTKEEADSLFGSECFGSMRCQVLHGDISQNTRQATIKQFRDGQIEVLIATDVAARGLDIAGVDLVLHTAPPNDHDTYVHRSGRTGRAGRNGTSICLFSGSEESKLRTFESQLNFKFERVGPPTVKDISEASALIVSRKLSQVNKNVVKYMIPHAKQIVANLQDSMGILADPVDPDAADFVQEEDEDGNPIAAPVPETEVNTMSLTEKYELLVAKCLAAMSNRKSMVSRSLQTGESGMTTLQVEAVFKNGTSPDNVRDWQRLFSGVLKRSFDMEEVRFGRVAIGRTESRAPCALVDVPNDTAEAILEAIEETKLPAGLGIKQCETLPHLVPDFSNAVGRRDSGGSGRSYVPSSRFGSGGGDRSYSGGGGDRSYSSGGGERSYSSGGSRPYSSGGGGDRSYSSGGDRPVTNGRVWTREGGAGTSAPSRDNESGGERRTFTSSRTFAPR